jgi:hypothetical protein
VIAVPLPLGINFESDLNMKVNHAGGGKANDDSATFHWPSYF